MQTISKDFCFAGFCSYNLRRDEFVTKLGRGVLLLGFCRVGLEFGVRAWLVISQIRSRCLFFCIRLWRWEDSWKKLSFELRDQKKAFRFWNWNSAKHFRLKRHSKNRKEKLAMKFFPRTSLLTTVATIVARKNGFVKKSLSTKNGYGIKWLLTADFRQPLQWKMVVLSLWLRR